MHLHPPDRLGRTPPQKAHTMTTTTPRLHRLLLPLAYVTVTVSGSLLGFALAIGIFWALTLMLGSVGAALAGVMLGAFLLGAVAYQSLRD